MNTQESGSLPRLSIVVGTRNDDHGGSMHMRFQTFLTHLGESCTEHGLDAELIVVEWNPPEDRPPLREAFVWPLSPRLATRIITVPHDLHRRFYNSKKLHFFQMIAKNVGIRRAKAQWVLATNVDILFNGALCERLKDPLDAHNFYRIDRTDISAREIPAGLTSRERMDYCRHHVIRLQTGDPMLHTNACGDFTLMHADAWRALRGYPEFALYSMHIDSWTLAAAFSLGLRQIVFKEPARIYHIEHGMGWATDKEKVLALPSLDLYLDFVAPQHLMRKYGPLIVNGPGWGLGDEELAECHISQSV